MRVDKYAVRRFVAFLLLLATAGVVIAGVSALIDEPSYTCPTDPVLVSEGDTIWDIGRTYCTGDTQAVIDLLVDFYGTDLRVGQRLDLPVSKP